MARTDWAMTPGFEPPPVSTKISSGPFAIGTIVPPSSRPADTPIRM